MYRVSKKNLPLPILEIFSLGEVFLGVKNNSKAFGSLWLFSKILCFLDLVLWKFLNFFLNFYGFVNFKMSKTKIFNNQMNICINIWWHLKKFSNHNIPIIPWKYKLFQIFLLNNVNLLKILLSNLIFFPKFL